MVDSKQQWKAWLYLSPAIVLLLAMCVSLFAGCAKEPAGTTAPSTAAPTQPTQPTEPSQPAVNKLENARKYVFNMYKDNAEETRRDFSVITSLLVGEDSFNVSWAIEVVSGDPAAVVVLDNGDGTATVSIVDKEPVKEVVYNLVGTVSDNAGNTDTVSFSFMIPAVEATGITFVKTPEIGVAYKYAVQQNKLGKTLYLTGEMSGKYLATSDNVLDAVDVFVEEVEGGYHVYFMDGETKKFVNITTYTKDDGSESKTQSIGEEPTCVYQWDAERGTMYATISIGTFYLGCYNTYNTVSASDVSYIQDVSKIGDSQFPIGFCVVAPTVVEKPETNKAYLFGVQQNKLGKTLYLTGEMSGNYLATSENMNEAVRVYVMEAEGGYHLVLVKDGVKNYINITTYTKDDGSVSKTQNIGTEPTCVYQWDAERGTMYATISIGTFYLGTYNTYATISTSDVSYIQDISKIGESQFPAVFFDLNLPNEEIPADVEPTEPTEPTT